MHSNTNIEVLATAREKLLPVAAGFAKASGSRLIDGSCTLLRAAASLSVVSVDNKTSAFIGANAVVLAHWNVVVRATDETDIDPVVGARLLDNAAWWSLSIGASVAMVAVTKETRAWIGDGATVDAWSAGPIGTAEPYCVSVLTGCAKALTGVIGPDGVLETKDVTGVLVQAFSYETVQPVVSTGNTTTGSGSYPGVSGAMTYVLLDSNTEAFVGENAKINTTGPVRPEDQLVLVWAGNRAFVFGVAANAQGRGLGIAGGVSVAIVNNDTSAEIRDDARRALRRRHLRQHDVVDRHQVARLRARQQHRLDPGLAGAGRSPRRVVQRHPVRVRRRRCWTRSLRSWTPARTSWSSTRPSRSRPATWRRSTAPPPSATGSRPISALTRRSAS